MIINNLWRRRKILDRELNVFSLKLANKNYLLWWPGFFISFSVERFSLGVVDNTLQDSFRSVEIDFSRTKRTQLWILQRKFRLNMLRNIVMNLYSLFLYYSMIHHSSTTSEHVFPFYYTSILLLDNFKWTIQ